MTPLQTVGTLGGRWRSLDAIPTVIGEYAYGGYYAGIINTSTSKGGTAPIATDAFQTGAKYALIVSPKSLESSSYVWKTTNDSGPTGVKTRWNGLGATAAMTAAGSNYQAATYCSGLSYPVDGGSAWYLPAMDELELLYRNLKPTTANNYTSTTSGGTGYFPYGTTSVTSGFNPSSSPAGSTYSSTVPAQTSVTLFQDTGAQFIATNTNGVWSSTEVQLSLAWGQGFGTVNTGLQFNQQKIQTGLRTRPVRRVIIP